MEIWVYGGGCHFSANFHPKLELKEQCNKMASIRNNVYTFSVLYI